MSMLGQNPPPAQGPCNTAKKLRGKKPITYEPCFEHWILIQACTGCDHPRVNLAKHREQHGVLEFAALVFRKFCGQAGEQVFRTALKDLQSHERAIVAEVDAVLVEISEEYCPVVVMDYLRYAIGERGGQKDLVEDFPVEQVPPARLAMDAPALSRLLDRAAFRLTMAVFDAVLKHSTGYTHKKLAMFEPIKQYLMQNRHVK